MKNIFLSIAGTLISYSLTVKPDSSKIVHLTKFTDNVCE